MTKTVGLFRRKPQLRLCTWFSASFCVEPNWRHGSVRLGLGRKKDLGFPVGVHVKPALPGAPSKYPVFKWLTQNHASRIKKADIRSYLWLGLSFTNRIIYPGFEHVAHLRGT